MNLSKSKKLITYAKQFAGCFVLMVSVGLAGCGGGGGGGGSDGEGDGAAVGVGTTNAANAANADGTATLSWVAPSTRVDNTPLPMSDIGGYKVYMGGSVGTLELHADISDPYQMELVVENLATGTYYFAVTAYNQYGAESDFSVVTSKSI